MRDLISSRDRKISINQRLAMPRNTVTLCYVLLMWLLWEYASFISGLT